MNLLKRFQLIINEICLKRRNKQKPSLRQRENPENGNAGNWSEDQQKKSYYYDDSYGYEIYDPNDDDENDDEDENE